MLFFQITPDDRFKVLWVACPGIAFGGSRFAEFFGANLVRIDDERVVR
jgi:hypothetical protein